MRVRHYSTHSIDKADIDAVVSVLKSDSLTRGTKVPEFEKALCRYTKAKYAVCFSSATTALYALLNYVKGNTVVTSPYTFVATTNAVLQSGKKLLFSDVGGDFNICASKVTKADVLIAVDFAGNPCDYKALRKSHKGILIADAAHSFGASYYGKKVGTLADHTVLSFHPVKSITTGEGGAVLTNEKSAYEFLKLFRNHGLDSNKDQQILGNNYHMSDIQAALGLSQLTKLNSFIKTRQKLAKIYLKNLKDLKELCLPSIQPKIESAWHLFPVFTKKRDSLKKYLLCNGINSQIHYKPVYLNSYYQKNGFKNICKPVAETLYEHELSLPLHPKMKVKDVNYICSIIKKYFQEGEGAQ